MKLINLLICQLTIGSHLCAGQVKAPETAKELTVEADTLNKNFKYNSASAYYFKAASLYEKQKEWLLCVKNFRLASNMSIQAAKYDTAFYYSRKAFDIADKYFQENNKDEMFEKSNVLLCIADLNKHLGKYKDELTYCKKALRIFINVDSVNELQKADVLNEIGCSFINLKVLDSAFYFCNRALEIQINLLGENDVSVAKTYFNLGSFYSLKEESDKALYFYQKSLSIKTAIGLQSSEVAACINKIGGVYYDKGNYDKALECFQKSLKLRIALFGDQHPDIADSYISLGLLFRTKAKYKVALEYFQKCLWIDTTKFGKQHQSVADAYNFIGSVYYLMENLTMALNYFQKALEIEVNINGENNSEMASIYINIGKLLKDKGEYEKAYGYFIKALNIRVNIYGEQHALVAKCYSNLSLVLIDKGEYNKALEYIQKALKIRISTYGENHLEVASSYYIIGIIYRMKGNYDKASEYCLKSLQIRSTILGETNIQVAASYNSLAISYYYKEEYEKALECYQKALKIQLVNKDEYNPEIGTLLNNIGMILNDEGKYKQALEYYQRALKIQIHNYGEQHPDVANSYTNIGGIYKEENNYNSALEFYQKGIQIQISAFGKKHPHVANSFNDIGILYYKEGKSYTSLQYFQKALTANLYGYDDTSVYSNPNLVNILSKPILITTLANKANAFYQFYIKTKSIQNLESSLLNFELSFKLISDLRSDYSKGASQLLLSQQTKNYFAEAATIALEYYEINPTHANLEKVLEFIERGKGAALSGRHREYEASHYSGISDSLLENEKKIRTRIDLITTQIKHEKYQKNREDTLKVNALENENFTCSQKLDSMITYFETTYPRYYEIKYANKIPSIPEIQKILDGNTAILDYFLSDSNLFIATITDSLYKIEEIPIDSLFNKLVISYYKEIKTAETNSFADDSHHLYEKLIRPVETYISNKEHLIIVPDDYLNYLPFETLIDNSSITYKNINDYSKLNYLIKSHSISYHHSATLWYNSKKRETKTVANRKVNFVGFAPVFSTENNNGVILFSNLNAIDTTGNNLVYRSVSSDLKRFNPLPYSKEEIISIVHLFEKRKKEAKAYLYTEASESNFKKDIGNFSIIHISSHGFANDKEPDLSGIVFSQPTDSSNKEDGILYAGETYNLNLNADLIVLSSCESGFGKLIKGEGLQALSTGFLYSGAPNIIFSLWKALDKQTKDLMVQFYSNALDDKTYAESLKQAKLYLIKDPKTAFPYFWSGFVLIGK